MRYLILLATAVLTFPAAAGVTVSFDAETLDKLLRATSAQEVEIPISDSRTLRVKMENLRLTALDPSPEDEAGRGYLRTSVDVTLPDLGAKMALKPTVVLDVVKDGEFNVLELRFARLPIPVPLLGSIDIASFLDPLRYPAEDLWSLAGARGNVEIRSRLVGINMGQKAIRFEFEIEITEP